jgi:ATPase subunit of ABC transporter with duplicated ATPase domains
MNQSLCFLKALFLKPDILLLDEPTNHLDLSACMYLEEYLVEQELTCVVVSHDGEFLDSVCTDIIKFEHCKLVYHSGNYSSFREMEEESFKRHRSTGDAAARKEKKVKEFINKQKSMGNSKHRDDNKQKQAAERSKKLGRLGLFAENGHRFSLLAEGKTGGAGANRAGHIFGTFTSTNGMQSAFVSNEKVAFGEDKQLLNFKFPSAPPLSSGGGGGGLPLITMENCCFGYAKNLRGDHNTHNGGGGGGGACDPSDLVLRNMTLGVSSGSRVAIVGQNGAGKSTLVKLLVGDLAVDQRAFAMSTTTAAGSAYGGGGGGGGKKKGGSGGSGGSGGGGGGGAANNSGMVVVVVGSSQAGKYTKHPNLKVAYIAQHHVEQLAQYLEVSPVQYFMRRHSAKTEQEARQFLGGFGLVGSLALQLIGTLSGGQKARLVFATVMFTQPHVLVLDEPTNHLDKDSLESLSSAVRAFQGAVVMVSHNQEFMASCANEMWTVEGGKVKVQHVDECTPFDELFQRYRASLRKMKQQKTPPHQKKKGGAAGA